MENASAPPSSSAAPQAQAQPAQQNITVTNRQLNITPFVIDCDPTNTANRWDKWKEDIERQFRFFGIQDPELKKDGLIIYGGRDIADLEDSLPDVESTDPPADEYTKFIRKLDKHFLPKKNKDYARFQLGNLQQEEDESLAKYFARVREIAKKCEYHDENDAIRDHLIKTMRNRRIRVKAIRQGWSLQEILDEAAIDEETDQQASEMEKKISHKEKDVKRIEEMPTQKPCGRCGRKHTEMPGDRRHLHRMWKTKSLRKRLQKQPSREERLSSTANSLSKRFSNKTRSARTTKSSKIKQSKWKNPPSVRSRGNRPEVGFQRHFER